LFEPSRYKVLYGGRGGAKSWGVARALLIKGAAKPIRVLCAREIQVSIADSVHKLLSDQVASLGLESHYVVQNNTIRGKNGTEFAFAGIRSQDVAKIKSFEGVDICWVEEAQTVTKKSWDVLIPTIRKEGSEIWVTFNPELDSDETYQRFVVKPPAGAVVVNINWEDNPFLPETLRKEKDDLYARDPESADNVWGGKPNTVVAGAIYRHEIASLYAQSRFRPVPIDPLMKVHTVWDLGWNDQTTIIFVQRQMSELRVVDYIEDSHRTLAQYVAEVKTRADNWGTDWLPHDGDNQLLQADGLSAREILTKLGRKVAIVPKLDVEQGIKLARLAFGRCYFDSDRTVRLIDCLKRYKRGIPATTGEPGSPVHDQYSHGADAFRYLATVADKLTNDDVLKMKPLVYPNNGIR
jgi:phage terminase large subunit